MASVTQGAGHDLCTTVMTVESGLRNNDAQRLVHDYRTGRFPINATLILIRFESVYVRSFQVVYMGKWCKVSGNLLDDGGALFRSCLPN